MDTGSRYASIASLLTRPRAAMMGGWKVWTAGAIMHATGVWLCYRGSVPEGLQCFAWGVAFWGIGHKIEKGGAGRA